MLMTVLVLVGVLALRPLSRLTVHRKGAPVATWKMLSIQTAIILALCTAVAPPFHYFREGGLLESSEGFAVVEAAHFAEQALTEITAEELERMLLGGAELSVIDARHRQDYLQGHLENAVNVEPSSGLATVRATCSGMPAHGTVVVYCQSLGCKYAVRVSKNLRALGFDNILYFKGGWREWEDYRSAKEPDRVEIEDAQS